MQVAKVRALGILCLLISTLAAPGATLPAQIVLNNGPGNVGTRMAFIQPAVGDATENGAPTTAFGDFNRDGYDDLIVGYPNAARGGTKRGVVYVVYGAAGYAASQDINSLSVATISCTDNNALLGAAVAAADVDGDGADDLILGAPGTDGNKGAVLLLNGASLTSGATLNVNVSQASPTSGETRIYGTLATAQLGYSLAVADFDGDGKDDLLAGEPFADISGRNDAGRVFIWFGADLGFGTTIDSTAIATHWELSGAAGDDSGSALATGDFDGDGHMDAAIGAVGHGGSGAVYVLYAPAYAATTYRLDNGDAQNGIILGFAGLGTSIAAGDATGEGRDDLLMGAPAVDYDGRNNNGAAVLAMDLRNLGGNTLTIVPTNDALDQLKIFGAANNDGLGSAVAFNDLDGDGRADLILGASNASGTGGAFHGGKAYIRFSPRNVAAGIINLASTSLNVEIIGNATNGGLGATLAGGGDVDGDGFGDVLLQAPGVVGPSLGSGVNYLLYGTGNGTGGTVTRLFAAGDTPTVGFGGRLAPVQRVKARWIAGDPGNLSVALCRGCAVTGLGLAPQNVAGVTWTLGTNRTNSDAAELTFNYTDAELGVLGEDHLAIYQGDSVDGPWTRLGTQTRYPDRNEITGMTSNLGVFALLYEAPLITLPGAPELNTECGAVFNNPGATAASPLDGDITASIVVTGTVNTSVLGDYALTYDVMDSQNVSAMSKTRIVHVVDNSPPAVVLAGDPAPTVECGGTFTDPGVVAVDSCDGNVSGDYQVGGEVIDLHTKGVYHPSYTVTDSSGNTSAPAYRQVTVVDTTPPTLQLNGANQITIECGGVFNDPGVTAIDACDGDISDQYTTTGLAVDPNYPNLYTLTYHVADSSGNQAATVQRKVRVLDTSRPVITLIGGAHPTVGCQSTYEDPGAIVSDACAGDVTANLVVTGSVDTATPGDYTLTYNANDGNGNDAVAITRTVTVSPCEDGKQSVDQNGDNVVSLSELLRVIQFYNSGAYQCANLPGDSEDGYLPGSGTNHTCSPYDTDYNPQDWTISLSELLRVIQFYNSGGYHYCPATGSEDNFCPGLV